MTTRNTWSIYTLESGDVWVLDGTIYIPNNSDGLTMQEVSTQVKTQLIDGSPGFITPEVTYVSQPLTFEWEQIEQTFMEQIRTYQRNQESLKIVTDISGREFIGRFIDVTPLWLTNQENLYHVTATFELMPELDS